MTRFIAALIGLFFSGMLVLAFINTVYLGITEPAEETAEHAFHLPAKSVSYSFEGPFGHYDKGQLQRGLKVYKEVCAACHSLNLIAFRNFEDLGYSEGQIKGLAAEFDVPSIDSETGDDATRKGLPQDKWPSPYRNEVAARAANNNALPPDLSLMAKAREGGPEYIYSLLTGYADPKTYKNKEGKSLPKEAMPSEGLNFNPYFANLNLAMAKPLSDGQVTFDDGSKNDLDSMAKDVSAFLMWTAEPKLESRKAIGWAALLFTLIFTVLAFMSYRSIWADKKH